MESRTYKLEQGTILYRGDTPYFLERNGQPSNELVLENKPTFFALEPDDVHQYGIIYGWKVPETVELPLLNNHEVMTEIYNRATETVQQVMRENYGYRPDGFADRVSYFEKDIIFYQYLCEQGYPGYASYDLEEGDLTSLEIMVCNPTGYMCEGIFFPNAVKDQDLYIRNQIQKYYERVNPNGNQKKKKAKVAESPAKGRGWSPVKGNTLFGESPMKTGTNLFGESPMKTGTNLFGESPVKEGTNLFGESPVKTGTTLFGESPMKTGTNLFGESPVKTGTTLFGESPMKKGTTLFGFTTPKKKGGSKKNKKRKTRRRVIHSKNSKSHPHNNS
jgi:hypothetical protein